jgi:FkbM family methyltransferase
MEVYYGYDDSHYINITKEVFAKCFKDNGIYIPAGDGPRCDIIGFDPYPNILKHILIIDSNKQKHIYTFTKEVHIKFEPINQQLSNAKNPKIWWKNVGKFIQDPVARLNALQKQFNLQFTGWGGFEFEYPEQLMAMRFLNENSKVLEIGGNIGRTAHIIHTILNNPLHHVIMECDVATAKQLRYNLDMNTYTEARIETAALSKTNLYMDGGHGPRPIEDFKDTENPVEVPTISYSQICKKYGVNFDTLVADCEGSLFYIFKEDPDMLNNINLVIMENDYTDLDHKQMVDAILTIKGFKCIYREKGVPWASWSCCYEYFYEVWSK